MIYNVFNKNGEIFKASSKGAYFESGKVCRVDICNWGINKLLCFYILKVLKLPFNLNTSLHITILNEFIFSINVETFIQIYVSQFDFFLKF